MSSKRIHVFYSGSVQGVGFRFSAEIAARRLKVTGWVKNLSDGRVELVAEGEERQLKDLMEAISSEMSAYIRDADVSWEEPTGKFRGFGIAFER